MQESMHYIVLAKDYQIKTGHDVEWVLKVSRQSLVANFKSSKSLHMTKTDDHITTCT